MGIKSMTNLLFLTLAGWAGCALANGGEELHAPENSIFKFLIVPLGVATFFSVLTTISLGLKMSSNRELIFPWHKRMALITMLLALSQATMVIIFH
jgi:hypothetical protein